MGDLRILSGRDSPRRYLELPLSMLYRSIIKLYGQLYNSISDDIILLENGFYKNPSARLAH